MSCPQLQAWNGTVGINDPVNECVCVCMRACVYVCMCVFVKWGGGRRRWRVKCTHNRGPKGRYPYTPPHTVCTHYKRQREGEIGRQWQHTPHALHKKWWERERGRRRERRDGERQWEGGGEAETQIRGHTGRELLTKVKRGEATTAQPETSYDKLLRKCSNTILYLYQTV